MSELLQVVVLGLVGGGIYALLALGVVLVYRGTGVLTFAGGEIGTAAIFVASFVVVDGGAPWWVGAVVALGSSLLLGGLFELLVVRRMVGSGGAGGSQPDPVSVAVATVGLALLLLSSEAVLFGESPRSLPPPVAGGVEVAGVVVSATQLVALVLAAALAFGLQAVLRRTDFGLGVLAAAQDPVAVRLCGAPLSRITLTTWAVGGGLAGIAALMVAPTLGAFGPGSISELYVVGLAAAVIGGLTSLPGAFVGGVGLGIVESAASRYLSDLGVPGLRYVVVLTLLLAVLLGRQAWPRLVRALPPAPTVPASAR